ncbi:MAG: acetyl-CoA/propionyl-CoA carboxylase, biotin carboxylase, biotin carboxyl carrier protein [Actinomycetota bacterium]|nr:acetyl-CoA/propionyl-CoA carboxylase, biotin carboxylase, biotin carboxyl carrier protein [Actinomycetota bacterium]
MFSKILIANRGEIATRVARTCRELRVDTVAVYSDVDEKALHVQSMDEAVHLPGVSPTDTYLNVDAILAAAKEMGAEAIHPGYGFLSENADFAEAVANAGLVWIGPPAEATRAIGDKISARRLAIEAGVPVVPGTTDPLRDPEQVILFGVEHGYPLAIKAAGGGGGRGLKVAHNPREVDEAFASARREAEAYFGSTDLFVERYIPSPKHLEVQILAPSPDHALWLGVRDCSLQRRHQKLIEESPPPRFAERAHEMGAAAVALAKACGYVNAGTVEMLADEHGDFYFLEVNARLQVEHTVTEAVTGLDLVACQLRIAAGESLRFSQDDVSFDGHAIECRINAEDPTLGFAPTPGRLSRYREPSGPGVRVDGGYREGDEIPGAYDSLIAKVITHGDDREQARRRMIDALEAYEVGGVATTIPAHLLLLDEPSFKEGTHTTRTVEEGGVLDALQAVSVEAAEDVLYVEGKPVRLWHPSMSASAPAAVHGAAGGGELVAPMQGTVLKVLVKPGQAVEQGEALVVLEAMKMETVIAATKAGTVSEVLVTEGTTAPAGETLVVIE